MENPLIKIQTELGEIILELYPSQASITVANFLQYVDEQRFSEALFYRVVHPDNQPEDKIKIEVIQGGLKAEDHPQALPAIPHEITTHTGVLHTDGAISMARDEPGTASSEFFICVGDQPELNFGGARNPDGQGFAAFGKVIKGMEIVRKIRIQPSHRQNLTPEIKILAIERV
jgi:peptidyl-prolyl cis-trans isomerase A (cyclophilin A)